MGPKPKSLESRFWALVDKNGPDDCWNWTGSKNGKYGQFRINDPRTMELAHRVAFMLNSGSSIPDGYFVCHHCDNPICCNPAHLFLGTPKDNNADMWRKGRARPASGKSVNCGSTHGASKLTEADVVEIRLLKGKIPYSKLAKMFDVSTSSIGLIMVNKTWKHVPESRR